MNFIKTYFFLFLIIKFSAVYNCQDALPLKRLIESQSLAVLQDRHDKLNEAYQHCETSLSQACNNRNEFDRTITSKIAGDCLLEALLSNDIIEQQDAIDLKLERKRNQIFCLSFCCHPLWIYPTSWYLDSIKKTAELALDVTQEEILKKQQ